LNSGSEFFVDDRRGAAALPPLLNGHPAVQTLSRLNRARPQKHDCFVLDFQNNSGGITYAFQDYYRTTLLAEETDPNKLHDLKTRFSGASFSGYS
jgi:type I restriction enzyme R subunit